MNCARENIKTKAQASAAMLLVKAAAIVKVTRRPEVGKRFHHGNHLLTVRLFENNVIKVYDENTGEVWAVSKPDRHSELADGFMPPTPALTSTVILD